MGEEWFEALRPACKEACLDAGSAHGTDVVLFYLARWCQKKAKKDEPEIGGLTRAERRDRAERIVRNLADDGERVERLVHGDAVELSQLERLLLASASPRAGEAARDYAEEALQRIAIVLLTGTPPSRAAEELRRGPAGPRNEFVFQAPLTFWAQRVVINLVVDERRRASRQRNGTVVTAPGQEPRPLDEATLKRAHDSLPVLLAAIRRLPRAQRTAIVLGLCRPEVDELVRERLHELAPDLFSVAGGKLFSSDQEVAEHVGATAQQLRANRSLARRKLAERDGRWELLLDALLPHASTRPLRPREAVAAGPESEAPNADG